MIAIILRVLAFVAFFLAGVNQTILDQPPQDLVAFGLAAWVLATLLAGVGPAWPKQAPPA